MRKVSFFVTALALLAAMAWAHNAVLWAYVENGKVFVEAFFRDGGKIKDGQIVVVDAAGQKILDGKTDAEGKFSFTPPKREKLTIILLLDGGHRSEFVIEAEEFEENATPTPSPRKI